jgi:hypothetical protein
MKPAGSQKHAQRKPGLLSSCLVELFFDSIVAVLLVLIGLTLYTGATHSASANEPVNGNGSLTLQQTSYSPQPTPVACQVSQRLPEKVRQWCDPITRHALEHSLPPDLIAALIWQESGGNPSAYSRSGAVGLMQVMPRDGKAARFMCKNGPCFSNRPTIEELKDPEFNIQWGTGFLRSLVNHHNGNIREALKSYGPMDMGYRYADIVLSLYSKYKQH